ncbi:MAG: hypothetical protein AAGH46_06490 [Bacteroidota bacterium]
MAHAFDVDMDNVVKLSAKLGKLHKSAFPVAVRGTLNDAAFMTKSLVPKVAARNFTIRQKNFFRAFSTVVRAKGFNTNTMVATVGINADKGSEIAEGLEQQEIGGTIEGRKLIPHDRGRVSGSYGKKLKAKNRFRNINIATRNKRKKGANYMLIKKGGKGTVFEIKRLKTRTKLTPIFTYRNTRKSRVQKAPFMRPSATLASSKMPTFYQKRAQQQFLRALK